MVDRKMYSRSRQKELLNRVVDEELYKPEDPRGVHGADRGIAELLLRQRRSSMDEHGRHRLTELMGRDELIGEDGRPPVPVVLPVRRPGFWTRLRRRIGAFLSR